MTDNIRQPARVIHRKLPSWANKPESECHTCKMEAFYASFGKGPHPYSGWSPNACAKHGPTRDWYVVVDRDGLSLTMGLYLEKDQAEALCQAINGEPAP